MALYKPQVAQQQGGQNNNQGNLGAIQLLGNLLGGGQSNGRNWGNNGNERPDPRRGCAVNLLQRHSYMEPNATPAAQHERMSCFVPPRIKSLLMQNTPEDDNSHQMIFTYGVLPWPAEAIVLGLKLAECLSFNLVPDIHEKLEGIINEAGALTKARLAWYRDVDQEGLRELMELREKFRKKNGQVVTQDTNQPVVSEGGAAKSAEEEAREKKVAELEREANDLKKAAKENQETVKSMQEMIRNMAENDEKREKELAEKFEKRWKEEEARKLEKIEKDMRVGKGNDWNPGYKGWSGSNDNNWSDQRWNKGGWNDEMWAKGKGSPQLNGGPTANNLDARKWGVDGWPGKGDQQMSEEDMHRRDWENYKASLDQGAGEMTKGRTLNAAGLAKLRKRDDETPEPASSKSANKNLTKKQLNEIRKQEKAAEKAAGKAAKKGKGKKEDQKPNQESGPFVSKPGNAGQNDKNARRPKRLRQHPTFDGLEESVIDVEGNENVWNGNTNSQFPDELLGLLEEGVIPNRQERKQQAETVAEVPQITENAGYQQGYVNPTQNAQMYDDQFDLNDWGRESVAGSWGTISSWGGPPNQHAWGDYPRQSNFFQGLPFNNGSQPSNYGMPNFEANHNQNPG